VEERWWGAAVLADFSGRLGGIDISQMKFIE